MSRTLLRLKNEGGISLEMPQQKRASSPMKGRISWFFSSCSRKLGVPLCEDWDHRDPLMRLQESKSSMLVVRGPSCFLSNRCWGLGLHLKLSLELQVSSPVLIRILGFLWSFNRGVRPHPMCSRVRFMWRYTRVLSSRAVRVVLGFLSR